MIRPKNETEVLLLSKTSNCETLIEPTHRKAEGTLEFKLTKSGKTFHFIPPIWIEGSWMLSLTGLDVHNSILNITEENNKFGPSTDDSDDEFSFIELKDNITEVLSLSDISPEDLQNEIQEPNIIETYRKLSTEKSQTDGYYILLTD